jgi:hypothetical protein
MPKKHNAGGCGCCCVIAADSFGGDLSSWFQEAGDWVIKQEFTGPGTGTSPSDPSNYYLSTNDSGSVIVRTEETGVGIGTGSGVNAPGRSWILSGSIRVEYDGDEAGVVFGYIDVDDYWYLSITCSDTEDYCGSFKLVRHNGGDTVLLEQNVLGLQTGVWHDVVVCVRDTPYPGGATIRVVVTATSRPTPVSFQLTYATSEQIDETFFGFTGVHLSGTSGGSADFDNFQVQAHHDTDVKCPECPARCEIVGYGSYRGGWPDHTPECEWSAGVFASGYMELAGNLRSDCLIQHSYYVVGSGYEYATVIARIQADTIGQKIRIYACAALGGNGPWGEVEFKAGGLITIRVNNNGGEERTADWIYPLTDEYEIRLCVYPTGVSFGIQKSYVDRGDYICVRSYKPPVVGGAYAAIENIGAGTTGLCHQFLYMQQKNDVSLQLCNDCVCIIFCDVCKDQLMPDQWLIEVSGVSGSSPPYSEYCPRYNGNFFLTSYPCGAIYYFPGEVQAGWQLFIDRSDSPSPPGPSSKLRFLLYLYDKDVPPGRAIWQGLLPYYVSPGVLNDCLTLENIELTKIDDTTPCTVPTSIYLSSVVPP